MLIKIVENSTTWDQFVRQYTPNTLLQSGNWLEFSKGRGEKVFPLGLFDNGDLIGAGLFTKVVSKRANYLVCHGGPMVDYTKPEQFQTFHQYLLELSKKEKVDFFRIRPPLWHSSENLQPFLDQGYRLAPMYFQAEHTLHLDLTLPKDELLKNMRKNTRYYVRKAEKLGVQIRISKDIHDVDVLYTLYQKTVQRQKFVPYSKEYFVNEFESFRSGSSPTGDVDLVIGSYQGQDISAAMVLYYDKVAYYHHGASIRLNPDVYASYLVQWAAIQQAQKNGTQLYDFWGVAPTDDPEHPRSGLTLFKRGFGGKRVRWLHTLDYPTSVKYWPMYLYVKYERWQRRL